MLRRPRYVPMKTAARILFSVSFAWLIVVALHSLAWLIRPLFPAVRWVSQLAGLPLLSPSPLAKLPWPSLLGIGGVLVAVGLSAWDRKNEKARGERGEA